MATCNLEETKNEALTILFKVVESVDGGWEFYQYFTSTSSFEQLIHIKRFKISISYSSITEEKELYVYFCDIKLYEICLSSEDMKNNQFYILYQKILENLKMLADEKTCQILREQLKTIDNPLSERPAPPEIRCTNIKWPWKFWK